MEITLLLARYVLQGKGWQLEKGDKKAIVLGVGSILLFLLLVVKSKR